MTNQPDSSDSPRPDSAGNDSGMDAEERRLWDLEGEDEFLEGKESRNPLPQSRDEGNAPEKKSIGMDLPESAPKRKAAKKDDDLSEDNPEKRPSFSGLEKISLAVFGVIIIAIVSFVMMLFFRELPTDDPSFTADFPVQGTSLVIDDIETYWRKPDASKDRGIKTDAVHIPAGMITLGKDSKSAALRIFFENDEGDLVGDPITLTISNGKFSRSGKNSAEVYCTHGFSEIGDLPAYLTNQIEPWSLIVREGPSADARGNQFKEILRLPIAPNRR